MGCREDVINNRQLCFLDTLGYGHRWSEEYTPYLIGNGNESYEFCCDGGRLIEDDTPPPDLTHMHACMHCLYTSGVRQPIHPEVTRLLDHSSTSMYDYHKHGIWIRSYVIGNYASTPVSVTPHFVRRSGRCIRRRT